MNTVYGVLVDAIGHASTEVVRQGAGGPELRHVGWASPAAEFRAIQPDKVTVDIDHDGYSRGEVVYLERNRGRLWAVGVADRQRAGPAVGRLVLLGNEHRLDRAELRPLFPTGLAGKLA